LTRAARFEARGAVGAALGCGVRAGRRPYVADLAPPAAHEIWLQTDYECIYMLDMRKNALSPHPAAAQVATFCTCSNIRRASRAVTQTFDAILQPSGLKMTQLALLIAVARVGQAPLTRLAEGLVMDRTTLTRNVKPLESRGFIRIEAGEDKRKRMITLTDRGREALETALPLWERAQSQVVAGLGRRRWQQLLEDLSALVALLRARPST
jgi:DNA-binding MarR family transcriptional regulator